MVLTLICWPGRLTRKFGGTTDNGTSLAWLVVSGYRRGLLERGRKGDSHAVMIFSLKPHREPQRAVQNSCFRRIIFTSNFFSVSVHVLVAPRAVTIVFKTKVRNPNSFFLWKSAESGAGYVQHSIFVQLLPFNRDLWTLENSGYVCNLHTTNLKCTKWEFGLQQQLDYLDNAGVCRNSLFTAPCSNATIVPKCESWSKPVPVQQFSNKKWHDWSFQKQTSGYPSSWTVYTNADKICRCGLILREAGISDSPFGLTWGSNENTFSDKNCIRITSSSSFQWTVPKSWDQ